MNHLIDIEQKINTQNATTGANTVSWSVFQADVFCDIEALSVKGYLQSRADQSDVSVRITIPFISELDSAGNVNSTMRLVGKCGCHEGRIYNPVGILEDNITGQEYITLPCSQGVNNG